jgi:lipid II:glycine glycyltransferase (peptidoglycan interpeptide bridge formation enzyme)
MTVGAGLTVRPISAAEHLAFAQRQRSVRFLQNPAWGRVKTKWRSARDVRDSGSA